MGAKQSSSASEIFVGYPLRELEVFVALSCLFLALFGFLLVFSLRWSTTRPLPHYTLCIQEYSVTSRDGVQGCS